MAELFQVELFKLAEVAKLAPSFMMHRMTLAPVKIVKLTAQKAVDILRAKPGGPDVIKELTKRGKIKGLSVNPGDSIGYSDVTSGDGWYARNAEINGPNPTSLMFCCTDGPNGYWQSYFNMPALDDFMAMVHLSGGNGSVTATLDGILLGNFPFSGDDWIVVPVQDLSAGFHSFRITQVASWFRWLSTQYFRL